MGERKEYQTGTYIESAYFSSVYRVLRSIWFAMMPVRCALMKGRKWCGNFSKVG